MNTIIELIYTNHRGETAYREIRPELIYFGSTEWHPEPQWLLRAFDCAKQESRDFALAGFGWPAPTQEPVVFRRNKAGGSTGFWHEMDAQTSGGGLIHDDYIRRGVQIEYAYPPPAELPKRGAAPVDDDRFELAEAGCHALVDDVGGGP